MVRTPSRSFVRHPVALAVGAACVLAVLGLNVAAFVRGEQAPWLLGSVIIADMLVVAAGILVAVREVLVAEKRVETTTESARVAVQKSEARLSAVVDSAMDAILTVDASQKIVYFNRAAEQVFRVPREQAIGTPLERFIPQRYRQAHHAHVEQFGRTGVTSRRMGDVTTLWGVRADGEEFPLEASISQTGEDGQRFYTVILRDITLRKKAEAESDVMQTALTETQARLVAIVDSAMDAVVTIDEAQKIVLFNRAAETVFRVPREQALGSPLERFLPQRFRAAHRGHVEHFGRTGVTSRRMGDVTTLWGLRADGEEFPLEASISQAGEPGQRYFTVILRDITLRKQNEDMLLRQQAELRELSARVLEAREEEKTRIARELHDELGQLLTALKMDLAWFRERLPQQGELLAKAEEMGRMLDQTVSSTRRISADLRPLMLDDLGLADAANWLVDDFARRSGVQCEMRLAGNEAMMEVDKRVATAVYRALQESLTNIARHSGASHAWVLLAMDEGRIEFEVEDDGRGIGTEDLAKARSLGLKGMRERVAYFGGSLEIGAAPRGGTRIRGRVPAQAPAERTTA
jgi:hypothetical protein